MIKSTNRQFSTLTWTAKSPSQYELLGFPEIKASFNGQEWQLNNITTIKFPSMQTLSEVIEIVAKNFDGRRYR